MNDFTIDQLSSDINKPDHVDDLNPQGVGPFVIDTTFIKNVN